MLRQIACTGKSVDEKKKFRYLPGYSSVQLSDDERRRETERSTCAHVRRRNRIESAPFKHAPADSHDVFHCTLSFNNYYYCRRRFNTRHRYNSPLYGVIFYTHADLNTPTVDRFACFMVLYVYRNATLCSHDRDFQCVVYDLMWYNIASHRRVVRVYDCSYRWSAFGFPIRLTSIFSDSWTTRHRLYGIIIGTSNIDNWWATQDAGQ